MSGYAACGRVSQALTIYDDLAKTGRTITSLPCLTDLLHALVDAKDQANAQRIVRTTAEIKAKSAEYDDSRYWRHHFWHFAELNGLWSRKMDSFNKQVEAA
jgi:hypothetical protein